MLLTTKKRLLKWSTVRRERLSHPTDAYMRFVVQSGVAQGGASRCEAWWWWDKGDGERDPVCLLDT